MKIDKNFNFSLNVSAEGYEKKTDAIACLTSKGAEAINRKKMCFFEKTITVDEFLDYAQNGYTFCAIYRFEPDTKYWYETKSSKDKGVKYYAYPHYRKNSNRATKGGLKVDFKRDEFYTGSQCIFIDVDLTRFSDVNEYISTLTFKPTMVYMSYSDGIEKHGIVSRRFHLCYVFDKLLDKDEFKKYSSILSESLVRDTQEELDDKCGEKMSQYMNGCFANTERYTTYSVYSISDFSGYRDNNNINSSSNVVNDTDKTTTLNHKTENDTIEVEPIVEKVELDESNFDLRLLNDWDRLDIEEFKHLREWEKYRRETKYYYRFENEEWIENKYQIVNDDYFRLYYNTTTVLDGQKRRKNLFQRMCLRKVMNPKITPMELAVNTILDIMRFYDNKDSVLNSDFIIRNIESCMALSVEQIKEKYAKTIEYLKNTTKPKKGIIYYSRTAHSKETTNEILDRLYDPNLTVNDNIANLEKEHSLSLKKTTIYEYLKDRGFKTNENKLTDEELLGLTDFSISANANIEYIKSLGYKIGNKRYNKLYKLYSSSNNNSSTDNSTTLNLKTENDTTPDFDTDYSLNSFSSNGTISFNGFEDIFRNDSIYNKLY